jgi:hypothetical protein
MEKPLPPISGTGECLQFRVYCEFFVTPVNGYKKYKGFVEKLLKVPLKIQTN